MLYLTPVLTIYILGMVFILGAVFASFLGCLGWRMSKGESMSGRSHCDSCGHVLGWKDLIPIVSYIARKGRCAYCKAPIPKSSLIGEILLATVFVLATIRFNLTPQLVLSLIFICILYLLSMTDIYVQIIPDSCLVVAIVARLLYYFIVESFHWSTFLGLLIDGFSISVPLLLLTLLMEKVLKKEAMGGGDIKLVFVTGLYLGWANNLLMMLVACIVGIVIGAVQLRRQGDEEETERYFPFGPSIAIATVFCLLYGEGILTWYMSLF